MSTDFERLIALRNIVRARGGASYKPTQEYTPLPVGDNPEGQLLREMYEEIDDRNYAACRMGCGDFLTIEDRYGVCRECMHAFKLSKVEFQS